MALFRSDRKMRDRNPNNDFDYDKQRRDVRDRDGDRCTLERWHGSPNKKGPSLVRGVWRKCGRKANLHTVHVRRRNDCGRVPDHVDVAIRGCEACHLVLDGNWLGDRPFFVRVPPAAEIRAYNRIKPNTKLHIPPPFIPETPMDILPVGEVAS